MAPIPRPTVFNHPHYLDDDVYPEGVADIVGYWAEDRILGGVVVFDRRAERNGDGNQARGLPNVYLHPGRRDVTWRVTQLRDEQQQALLEFLLAERKTSSPTSTAIPCPLPIIVDARNEIRVDAEISITERAIYRDVWERKPLSIEEMHIYQRRPTSDLDYPETLAMLIAVNAAAGVPLPEGKLRRWLQAQDREITAAEKKVKVEENMAEGREENAEPDGQIRD